MLRFEGDRDFARPVVELFSALTDARFLVTCIPDVVSTGKVEADRASLVLRPGLSFARGSLDVDLRVADAVASERARVVLMSKGIGSSSTVEATLTFADREGGGRVHWVAEIKELGGLLKMVPGGLIRGAAGKVINDVWAQVDAKLGGEKSGC